MHILLLTQVTDRQFARLHEAVRVKPEVVLSRSRVEARGADLPVTAIIGGPPPELVEHLHHLQWVQFRTDSLEAWAETLKVLAEPERRVVVTRTRGSYNMTAPDHAMMLVLALARDLPLLLHYRVTHEWNRDGLNPVVLSESTLGLVGVGSIGVEVANRAMAFGMAVIGFDPSAARVPEGVPVYPPEELIERVGECDFLVLTAPQSPSTEGIIDDEVLAAMKPGSFLVNVARGKLIDTVALLEALDNGTLAGAGLDVVEPTPLPPEHPLWQHPRVILTCHTGQAGSRAAEVQFELILENVRRYVAGKPLDCLVDVSEWTGIESD